MHRTAWPYDDLPDHYYWRSAYRDPAECAVDPQGSTKFTLSRDTAFSSAGSCFARRLAEDLRRFGFRYIVTEPGPAWCAATVRASYNYGTYSVRSGDVFTAAQLEQLLLRALGRFRPQQDHWLGKDGTVLDPFRPLIQPDGFTSISEMRADRTVHLAALLEALEQSDVFIYTLGLTEAWVDRRDGAVFPICPGRDRGTFDGAQTAFVNFGVTETAQSLERAIELLREINPRLKVILTVSPVPLAATYAGPHVLRATTYSKSVLRVAADMVAANDAAVDYFAAYEVVTAGGFRPPYFDATGRQVTETAVAAVMSAFYAQYLGIARDELEPVPEARARAAVPVEPCDEEAVLAAIATDFATRP